MTCADARNGMDVFLDGELAAAEEAVLRAHLDECPSCARELEERRAFTEGLSDSFGRALEGAHPPAGEKERAVERMTAAARRRLLAPARIAAALAVAVTLGLVLHAFDRSAAEKRARVAALLQEEETRRAQIRGLHAEIARDLEFVHTAAPPDPSRHPAQVLPAVAANFIVSKLEPGTPPPPADPGERLSITTTADGATLRFVQHGDGRIRIVLPLNRMIEARGMADLQSRHADICERFSIAGRDGFVLVAGKAAAVDLKGQLDLMVRTGHWYDDVQWDAYRSWMGNRADADERVRELRERCRKALESASVPQVAVDARAIARKVEGLSRAELEAARARVEQEMKSLEERLRQVRELQGRARALRVYAESVR